MRTISAILALLVVGTAVASARIQSAGTFSWRSTGFREAVGGDVEHVTDLLVRDEGRTIWAAFYGRSGGARLAATRDSGRTWTVSAVPGLRQVRAMVELPDGSVVLGGAADRGMSPLVVVPAGARVGAVLDAQACGSGAGSAPLPGPASDAVWDVLLSPDGVLYITTDSLRNDPRRANATVFRSTDGCRTLTALAPLRGLGSLAIAIDGRGRLYVSTADSAEHDDAEAAGRAHVHYSDDQGRSWQESAELDGANRVYRLAVLADGSVWAGTGLRGRVYRSTDRGASWAAVAPVPDGTRMFGNPPISKAVPATRVYAITQLSTGAVVVGTGNSAGDIFVTTDAGTSWQPTGDTGPSIVCWAIVEAPDGVVWIGTGSRGGDIWIGRW